MLIKKIINPPTQIRKISKSEFNLSKKILQTNLMLKKDESVLIVTDDKFLEKEAAIWFEASKVLTNKVELVVVEDMNTSGQKPPQKIVDKCKVAKVVILHTYFSLTHTQAGKKGRLNGGRVASLPGVDYEMMIRTLQSDYSKVNLLGSKLKSILEKGRQISIKSSAGTDLTSEIRSNKIYNDGGFMRNGELGNLPAGEVFFSPVKKTTNGTWVVDGSLADDTLMQPLSLTIESGKVIGIEGDEVAERLKEKLKKLGDLAFNIAELGIGTNPNTNPKGSIIEAEKAYGTAHIAVGNNSSMGGSNNVPIHLDGLTLNPTVFIDNKIIIKDGEFVI